jgi:hypothetical protein
VPSAKSVDALARGCSSGHLKREAGSRGRGEIISRAAFDRGHRRRRRQDAGGAERAARLAHSTSAINLQRWRYMPDDLGERHFLVNIPYYHLIARESGKPVMDIRVVVGKPGNNTPIFSEDMESVVFSPYWNIPDTIAESETCPRRRARSELSRPSGH